MRVLGQGDAGGMGPTVACAPVDQLHAGARRVERRGSAVGASERQAGHVSRGAQRDGKVSRIASHLVISVYSGRAPLGISASSSKPRSRSMPSTVSECLIAEAAW